MELTAHQEQALEKVLETAETEGTASLVGLAGTGKTVTLATAATRLGHSAMVVAPTGRAASVLRRKGVVANTIHSALYGAATSETYAHLNGCEKDELTSPDTGCIQFSCKATPHWGGRKADLHLEGLTLLVDEASMVNDQTLADLRSTGATVVLFGDHGQLPPVVGKTVLSDPTAVLTEIHRQAAESPIVRVAHKVRNESSRPSEEWKELGIPMQRWKKRVTPKDGVARLCYTNALRHQINSLERKARGYTAPVVTGERVLCLQNQRTGPGGALVACNGEVGTVTELVELNERDGWALIRIDVDGGTQNLVQRVALDQFGRAGLHRNQMPPGCTAWDYGYGLTVHKAQGSQWNTVGVYWQQGALGRMSRSEHDQWLYTAITRAEENLVIVGGC